MTENVAPEVSTALDIVNGANLRGELQGLNNAQVPVWSSIVGNDFAAKAAVINAMSAAEPLADIIDPKTGRTPQLDLVNIVIEALDLPEQDGNGQPTGGINTVPRTTLITADGKAYSTVSGPVYRSVQSILGIVGHPSTWPGALPVFGVKQGKKPREFYLLEVGKLG